MGLEARLHDGLRPHGRISSPRLRNPDFSWRNALKRAHGCGHLFSLTVPDSLPSSSSALERTASPTIQPWKGDHNLREDLEDYVLAGQCPTLAVDHVRRAVASGHAERAFTMPVALPFLRHGFDVHCGPRKGEPFPLCRL